MRNYIYKLNGLCTCTRGSEHEKLTLLLMAFLLVGCAIQRQGKVLMEPPTVKDENAPHVYVIRKLAHYSSATLLTFSWDGQEMFALGAGEYAEYRVSPGIHTIEVTKGGLFGLPSHTMKFEKDNTYYIMIYPIFNPIIIFLSKFEIKVLENGEEIVNTYRYLPMQ